MLRRKIKWDEGGRVKGMWGELLFQISGWRKPFRGANIDQKPE